MVAEGRKVLVLSNADDLHLDSLSEDLLAHGLELHSVPDVPAARSWMEQSGLPHLMVVDLAASGVNGIEFTREMQELAGMPIITISDQEGSTAQALEALQYADDFVRRQYSKQC